MSDICFGDYSTHEKAVVVSLCSLILESFSFAFFQLFKMTDFAEIHYNVQIN